MFLLWELSIELCIFNTATKRPLETSGSHEQDDNKSSWLVKTHSDEIPLRSQFAFSFHHSLFPVLLFIYPLSVLKQHIKVGQNIFDE